MLLAKLRTADAAEKVEHRSARALEAELMQESLLRGAQALAGGMRLESTGMLTAKMRRRVQCRDRHFLVIQFSSWC